MMGDFHYCMHADELTEEHELYNKSYITVMIKECKINSLQLENTTFGKTH